MSEEENITLKETKISIYDYVNIILNSPLTNLQKRSVLFIIKINYINETNEEEFKELIKKDELIYKYLYLNGEKDKKAEYNRRYYLKNKEELNRRCREYNKTHNIKKKENLLN